MPTELRAKIAAPEWSWPTIALQRHQSDCDSAVLPDGLLVTLIAMLSFPGLGAIIEQYNQF